MLRCFIRLANVDFTVLDKVVPHLSDLMHLEMLEGKSLVFSTLQSQAHHFFLLIFLTDSLVSAYYKMNFYRYSCNDTC